MTGWSGPGDASSGASDADDVVLASARRAAEASTPDPAGPADDGPEAGGPEAGGPEAGGPWAGGPEAGGPADGDGSDDRDPWRRRGNPVARLLVLVVLAALVAGGLVLEDRSSPVPRPRATAGTADTAVVPRSDSLSTAWYCAAGSANAGGATDETIFVGNLSPGIVRATVTVMPGGEDAPRSREIRLGAYERGRVRVGDVVAAPSPGVLVEVSGGQAVVEHEVRGPTDVAMGACAHEPSRTWRFAAGSTVKGTTVDLELFNPFDDDAIVDIAFVTDAGTVEPSDVQGFVVDRRSKVRVPVTDLVPREERVAAIVRARTGRIVAEQVATSDGTDGRAGLGVSLGVTRPLRRWILPYGTTGSGTTSTLVLTNDALTPARVSIAVVLPGDAVLEPEEIVVPSRSVVALDPGGRTGAFGGFGLVVRSDRPIVADVVQAAGAGAEGRGLALAGPAAAGARRWSLAGSPVGAASALTVVNLERRPVTVEVRARTAGDPDGPASAPAFAVGPGRTVRIDLPEVGIRPEQVLEVFADGAVVVGREVYAPGVSASLAVPVAD